MSARFGRYELLRPLGAGGMAEVFLARYVGPEGFEKRLVIKRVLPRWSGDRRLLRMFFEEARIQVSLSHGNLVSVFDFGRVGNDYFIAMEHVPGADLSRLLAEGRDAGRKLSPRLVAHLGLEICRGLDYVHRKGFVHRDVSPRNVLLSSDGEVKLSDFGLVLESAAIVVSGVRGTLAYMTPEQARGEAVDGRGDLYALGLILAEALLGERPRASGQGNALEAARAGQPVMLDGPLAKVIARATQTAPADRYPSAEEMLAALEEEAAALGGSREASVRELAALTAALASSSGVEAPAGAASPATAVTEAAPAPRPTVDLRARPADRTESYFRDQESASFVDEVLGEAPAPPARRRWPLRVGVGVAIAVAVASIAIVATRAPAGKGAVAIPAVAIVPRAVDASVPKDVSVPVQVAVPVPVAVDAPAHVEPARAKKIETGTVEIQCTPWCIPYVDDRPRGQDGRHHTLVLSAGKHRVEARRLGDRLDRSVQVRAGQSHTVDFKFE